MVQPVADSSRSVSASSADDLGGVIWAMPAVWLVASLLMSVPALWPGLEEGVRRLSTGILMPHLWLSLILNFPLALVLFARPVVKAGQLALSGVWVAVQMAVSLGFYGGYLGLDALAVATASLNYTLLAFAWLAGVWLAGRGADGAMVTSVILAGLAATGGMLLMPDKAGLPLVLLSAFNLSLLVALLVMALWGRGRAARVEINVPSAAWMGTGLLFVAGLVADRVMMLLGGVEPAETVGGMVGLEDYSLAMALGGLAAVPAHLWFTLRLRGGMMRRYRTYRQAVAGESTYAGIESAHETLADALTADVRRLLLLHLGASALLILVASWLLQALQLEPLWFGMLRFAALGALFYLPVMLMVAALAWARRAGAAALILLVYLVANVLLSLASLRLGFAWYGWGQAVASMLAFALAVVVYGKHLAALPYHSFVREGALYRASQANGPLTPGESRG